MRIVQFRGVAALVAVAGAALLTGCANAPATTADSEIDYVRIAQIERAARNFGTEVIWVNYPTTRSTAGK
jgi:type IV pilus biogenesis protein CpaD/CtpE